MSDEVSSGDLDRLQALIERVVDLSSDMKTMVAVHEQRIGVMERLYENMQASLEKRRDDLVKTLGEINVAMESKNAKTTTYIDDKIKEVVTKMDSIRESSDGIKKIVWMGIGIFSFIGVIVPLLIHFLQITPTL